MSPGDVRVASADADGGRSIVRSLAFLHASTLVYLALPSLIFAFGWLKLPLAVAVGAAVVTGVYLAARSSFQARLASTPLIAPPWTTILLMVVLTTLWIGLSGAGGYGYQNYDYSKHNAVLKDLISQPWPVAYDLSDQQLGVVVLVYALGYYLPAALVGKLVGWPAANHALFLWTLLGALLAVSWFTVLVGRRWVVVTLAFIFFGGLDALGHVLLHRQMCPVTGHQEWWAYFWQYSSNTALLFWVPQHAIAGWIIPAALLYESLYRRHSSNVTFLFALSVLWSPLVSAGLVPFIALALMQTRLKHAWSLQNVLFAPLLLAIVGLYFSSHSQGVGRGWLWEITDLRADWPRLISFYLLEFGVYVAAAWGALSQLPSPLRAWWFAALAALLVFPFYAVGEWNDFAMRASIPTLFVFWLGVGKALVGSHTRMGALSRAALAVALIIGALGPGSELARSLINQPWRVRDPFGQVVLMTNPPAAQYLGMPDSPFFKQLARELEPVPPHTRLPTWRLESVRSGPARRLC